MTTTASVLHYTHFFFIGVGGAGMSAIAQYLSGNGKQVSGSDRLFLSPDNQYIKSQLEQERIRCFIQDGSGIDAQTEVVVISTAIEETNIEIVKAKSLGIPIILRASLLAEICSSKKTIAIAGTSGKSTTTAMLFHLLHENGVSPSLITGAGLASLQQGGKIGNAYCGKSEWLLIEADESDGTLVKYQPSVGLLLSVDKDHKEMDELMDIFATFRAHTIDTFIVNRSHPIASQFSVDIKNDFGDGTYIQGTHFIQEGFNIQFELISDIVDEQHTPSITVSIPTIGKHNMENALACLAVARYIGVPLADAAKSLQTYAGIYRRHQLLGRHKGITVIDDYAHNPAKIAASIKACQPVGSRLIAWFQPHGYGPTRFVRQELVEEIKHALRPQDQIWMSEIYYAGGTAVKDISANDLIIDLQAAQTNAHFVDNRKDLFTSLIPTLQSGDVLLLMGARDPSLEIFSQEIWQQVQQL